MVPPTLSFDQKSCCTFCTQSMKVRVGVVVCGKYILVFYFGVWTDTLESGWSIMVAPRHGKAGVKKGTNIRMFAT
jgi:hypothetical protein